jgi:hypothetical protein
MIAGQVTHIGNIERSKKATIKLMPIQIQIVPENF